MQTIRVLHCNTSADEGWTADSPDLKGWSVAGASYAETKTLAEEAVREQLATPGADGAVSAPADVEITHHIACMRPAG
jgi:predicted RNase H-like HicB family nuclease